MWGKRGKLLFLKYIIRVGFFLTVFVLWLGLLEHNARRLAVLYQGIELYESVHRLTPTEVDRRILNGSPFDTLKQSSHPIHLAAKKNKVKILEVLLRHGANINHLDRSCRSPLYIACRYNSKEAALFLLDQGAKPYPCTEAKIGLLPEATGTSPEVLRRLLALGVDVNEENSDGVTALNSLACKSSPNKESALLLLAAGAKVDACDHWECTPLHEAVKRGSKKLIKLLLKRGANPLLKTKDGKDAFELAKKESITKRLTKAVKDFGHEVVVPLEKESIELGKPEAIEK